ncbi:MAG: hypothetical protein ACFE85_11765 [Candidatus Hodarchaeota archaeon]
MCSVLYIYRGAKGKDKQERFLMHGFGVFWLNIALVRLFFFIIDTNFEGFYLGNLIAIFETFDIVNYIILYFYLYLYIFEFIIVIMLSMLFVWSSIKSKREFQAISSVISIGFVVIVIGWAFEAIIIKNVNPVFRTLPSLFVIIGSLIAISPLIGYSEFFSKPLIRLLIFVMIGLIATFLVLTLFFNLPLFIVVLIFIFIAIFVLILVVGYIIYFYAKQRQRESETRKDEIKNTISMFTRPPKITVEEAKFYREKGLCIVCKNKIARLNYVCPSCNIFYCVKCSEALTKLENACWVCDNPFDETKPVRLEQKIDDEIILE